MLYFRKKEHVESYWDIGSLEREIIYEILNTRREIKMIENNN